ncbi:MAG: hypothetical protein RL755_600 [Pseudomonadota bacterium]|jgi:hypothetical protein
MYYFLKLSPILLILLLPHIAKAEAKVEPKVDVKAQTQPQESTPEGEESEPEEVKPCEGKTLKSKFTVNANGTVTDKKAKLMWMQCSIGQSGPDCSGTGETFTYEHALQQAKIINETGFANFKDWHVPTLKELTSMVDLTCGQPVLNTTAFPNVPKGWFWTSSPHNSNVYYAWMVYYEHAKHHTDVKYGTNYVRLVRDNVK